MTTRLHKDRTTAWNGGDTRENTASTKRRNERSRIFWRLGPLIALKHQCEGALLKLDKLGGSEGQKQPPCSARLDFQAQDLAPLHYCSCHLFDCLLSLLFDEAERVSISTRHRKPLHQA